MTSTMKREEEVQKYKLHLRSDGEWWVMHKIMDTHSRFQWEVVSKHPSKHEASAKKKSLEALIPERR